jgi:hypothetical protein
MRVLIGCQAAAEDEIPCRSTWADVAQQLYGFDRHTAQRLAFVRWLVLTGRLSDVEPAGEQ